MSEVQVGVNPESYKREGKDEPKASEGSKNPEGKEEDIKTKVQITFKYSDHGDHIYIITMSTSKGETTFHLNGEELKLLEVKEMTERQKDLYLGIIQSGDSETSARLQTTLIYFHDKGLHRDFNNSPARLCLFSRFFYLLFHGKTLADKYVIDETSMRIEGREESISVPQEECDPSGDHYHGAFEELNAKAGLKG
jgi:hypothetical protein